jgi:iron complex outermembrane recepter protein
MRHAWLLVSAAAVGFAFPLHAQDNSAPTATGASPVADAGAVTAVGEYEAGEIVVTATRRSQALSDVPIAVSAVTAESLQNSGAADIRALNQLSPSLLVSSTSSEAGAGGARIRGIGTVGDNPGLESSVATFIDGVYRNRAGVALTELGEIERIEVLRGPQGTLFGRNASAGLINIVTKKPSFDIEGAAAFTYGNYDAIRAEASLTGPITADTVAARIDGVYFQRDGFLKDVVTGRTFNDRDRYLVRGQLLFAPQDNLEVRIIGDYADRTEECCAAPFLPTRNVTRAPDGSLVFAPNNIKALLERFRDPAGNPAFINDDPFTRRISVTPGRDFRSDVTDWGVSGEITWDLGAATLTSITAYRDWQYDRGQDADFQNLDILYRDGWFQEFRTFSQEVRLQGTLFDDRLDWLVGGYFADETLRLDDNLKFGTQYGAYATCQLVAAVNPALLSPASPACILPAGRPALQAAFGSLGPSIVSGFDRLGSISNVGDVLSRFEQKSTNWALFTHNVIDVTDALSLTVGVRYTNETKKLASSFENNNTACPAQREALGPIVASPAAPAALRPLLTNLIALSCLSNSSSQLNAVDLGRGRLKDDEWSGTAVLSYKASEDVLAYASYSKGYKAGGYNLDRAALNLAAPSNADLEFAAEKVDAYEIGLKWDGPGIDVNVAGFYQLFKDFQLNTFNGVSFEVTNVQGCRDDLGDTDVDGSATTGGCASDRLRPGVTSKGVELEVFARPAPDLNVNGGLTVVDTAYRDDLVGTNGRPLAPTLFQLPGRRLSNAPQYVITGGATYTPPIGDSGLTGLVYADFRYQSEFNTGSDLDLEKVQEGVFVVNARVGLQGPDRRWSIELWAQNLLDTDYQQVTFDAPLQGGGTIRQVQAGLAPIANQIYGAFLAEPRTYGVTLRTRF